MPPVWAVAVDDDSTFAGVDALGGAVRHAVYKEDGVACFEVNFDGAFLLRSRCTVMPTVVHPRLTTLTAHVDESLVDEEFAVSR